MSEKTMEIVQRFRRTIYLWMFLAFAIVTVSKLYSSESTHYSMEAKDPEPESEEFWPPDMVPHPGMPGEGPRKNEGDWA